MNKSNQKNPILEGQRYLEYLDSNPDYKYRDVANEFGVSKARVSQMIALVRKLPQKIIDNFYKEDKLEKLRNLTERKLRPLTLLDSEEKKIEEFIRILSN